MHNTLQLVFFQIKKYEELSPPRHISIEIPTLLDGVCEENFHILLTKSEKDKSLKPGMVKVPYIKYRQVSCMVRQPQVLWYLFAPFLHHSKVVTMVQKKVQATGALLTNIDLVSGRCSFNSFHFYSHLIFSFLFQHLLC